MDLRFVLQTFLNSFFSPNFEDDSNQHDKRRRKKERSSIFFRKKKEKVPQQAPNSRAFGHHQHHTAPIIGAPFNFDQQQQQQQRMLMEQARGMGGKAPSAASLSNAGRPLGKVPQHSYRLGIVYAMSYIACMMHWRSCLYLKTKLL